MKMLRRKKLLALLLAWTLLLTGCAADPVSSNPSSDMPSSSALSSNPSVSSEPELPPLNLSMPLNGETMLSTICDYGYVDKNGVFHYSPLWYTSYKKSWPAGKQDTQNIADGTPGAKAVYGDLAFGGYILMNDGTLRIASLIEVNDQAITALKQTNIDALYLKTEKSAVPRMYDVFAFDFTEKDGASYVYTANKSLRLDRPAGIVDVIKGLHDTVYLYADGTVDFGYYLDNGDKKSNEVLYPSVNFSAWTNLVQIERISNYMIGLNQEGRLICTKNQPGSPYFPEYLRKDVVRLFGSFIQKRDGTIYNLADQTCLGCFPVMDQIFSLDGVVLGVDTFGKVHLLSGSGQDEYAKWACTLTDVKTVWDD